MDFGKAPFWTSSAILLLSLAVTATVTAPSATLPNSALPDEIVKDDFTGIRQMLSGSG